MFRCDNTKLKALMNFSFDLHVELSEQLSNMGFETDYRRVDSFEVVFRNTKSAPPPAHPILMRSDDLLNSDKVVTAQLGDKSTTAQVHPRKLTSAMCEYLVKNNFLTVFEKTSVTAISPLESKSDFRWKVHISSDVDGQRTINARNIVLAVGPWGVNMEKLLYHPNVSSFSASRPELASHLQLVSRMIKTTRTHSVVSKNPTFMRDRGQEWPSECIFLQTRHPQTRKWMEPEFYPRPDGTIYCCGGVDEEEVPSHPKDVEKNEGLIQQLVEVMEDFCPGIEANQIAQNACYLPHSRDGFPIIGKAIEGLDGIFVINGMGVWGILLGPGSGKLLANLITKGETCAWGVDIAFFDPQRKKKHQRQVKKRDDLSQTSEEEEGPCSAALLG
eukprot:GDKJ01029213.1.p1 GENE.GDKJ01029213.1~~GDKJ01029213.1.p1  ORF type:complete len:387 (-),score=64.96 GDKJ01029213.1:96-1256(-)